MDPPALPADQQRALSPRKHHKKKSRSKSKTRGSGASTEDRERSRSPLRSHPYRRCWACDKETMPDKNVCRSCFADMARQSSQTPMDVSQMIKDAVQESMKEYVASLPSQAVPLTEQATPASESEEIAGGFDFALVQPYLQAVREAIEWESSDDEQPSTSSRRHKEYYSHLKKKTTSFPMMDEIADIIKEEWEKLDKKPPLNNRMTKLYPMKPKNTKSLDNPPTVDASVTRLAKHITLPRDNVASFKDVMEKKMDSELKKIYTLAGSATKPAVALTSVARAIRAWTINIEEAVRADADKEAIIKALDDFNLTADYVGEAAVDIIRCTARTMASSVVAKRALWLKSWSADQSSRQEWCKIPYDGDNLFGKELDSAIQRVTGGKSGLLPQDRKPSRRPNFQTNRFQQSRLRTARSYRPGREFKKNWQSSHANLQRITRQKTTTSTPNQQKSF
ncbi:lamina-associated polypeptide 2-like [Hyperolius riggenbachi]|uniref:lamina-associated polypeptide 2-like n=1 Tax=Hyperolius riggenbachi TaxID=752182 RepID=UPI0035A378BB